MERVDVGQVIEGYRRTGLIPARRVWKKRNYGCPMTVLCGSEPEESGRMANQIYGGVYVDGFINAVDSGFDYGYVLNNYSGLLARYSDNSKYSESRPRAIEGWNDGREVLFTVFADLDLSKFPIKKKEEALV